MVLGTSIRLIIGIIVLKCILHEASLNNRGFSKNFMNFRRQHEANTTVKLRNSDYASIRRYPFMAAIVTDISLGVCRASIIGSKWVLTSASCFINDWKNITVDDVKNGKAMIFSNSTVWNDEHTVKRKIVEFYNHEGFNMNTHKFDISVVKADRDFDGKYEKPTSFADPSYYYKSFSTARVLGWEFWYLTKIKVYIAPQKQCKRSYSNSTEKISDINICAIGFGQGGSKDDHGAPLYQHGRIIGVLSWSTYGFSPTSISVFTRISKFNTFILRITSGTQ